VTAWYHGVILALGMQRLAHRLVGTLHDLRFRVDAYRKPGPPIVVYQMGKVGSTSVVNTVRAHFPDRPVYNVHHLTKEGLDYTADAYALQGRAFPGYAYWVARYLYGRVDAATEGRWSVITLTRDLVARNVSGFFETLAAWYPGWCPRTYDRLDTSARLSLFSEMRGVFLERYPHDVAAGWFEAELEPVLGIDVLAKEFPRALGYDVYRGDRADLLVMRLENLSSCYQTALSVFFGRDVSHLDLARANVAEEKPYKRFYQEFSSWLVLPDDYLQRMYSTRYARHFYSETELSEFRKRWSEKA
jgi:hypothetical protein